MVKSHGFDDDIRTRVGRVRQPTPSEIDRVDEMLRADVVLALKSMPDDLTPLELHVANLIDGFRPVARVRKKSGLDSDDLHRALVLLRKRNVLTLVGVVEEAEGVVATDIRDDEEGTMPRGTNDVIPPHVMNEIQTMLDDADRAKEEEALGANIEGFDDEATTELKLPED